MIFKTIQDETTLSGQRIVGALQARKIAQQQATAQLEIDIACLKEYQVACQNGTVTTEQLDTIMHKASASAVEYSAKVKAGTGTAQLYVNAQRATNSALQEVSIGAGIASKAVKLFSTALNKIAFTAIIQGVSWLIRKVDEWIITAKEAKESANNFKESLSTFFSETQTNLKTISSLSDRFDELSKNVDDTGKKIGGTEEEYAEFLDICQQVGQIMPELITGYTNEGEAIITLQGQVDSLTDSYKEAIKAKAALFISKGDEEGNTIDSFFEDYDNFINGTQKGWFSFSPSPQFSNTAKYEEYYGYDKIYEWLSNVNGKTLEELNNQIKSTTGQIQNVYLRKVLEEAEFDINNITEDNYNAVHDVLNNKLIIMEKELSDRVLNIRSAFQNMLYADNDYWNIDDKNVLSAINSLYGSIDAEFIKNNELFSQKALQTFESDFVSLFNNDATKVAMVDFYTPIADDETVNDYADRIKSSLETVQSYCNKNGVTVPINFDDSAQTVNDLETQYQHAVDFAKGKFDGYDPTTFFKEHSINTQEEIDAWQEIAQGARDAADAEKEYIQGSTLNKNPISLPTSKTLSDLKDLNAELDNLGNAMVSLDSEGNFDLGNLDSIADYFLNLNLEAVSYDTEAVNNALKSLGNENASIEEQADAVNTLADQYLKTSNILDHLNEENAELMKFQLERMGISNAEEIVDAALNQTLQSQAETESVLAQYKSIVTGETLNLANVTAQELKVLIEEKTITIAAANQMAALAIKKQLVNGNTLNTSADINNLIELCKMLGGTATALNLYNKVRKVANLAGMSSDAVEPYRKQAEQELQNVIKTGENSIKAIANGIPKVQYDGGSAIADLLKDTGNAAAQAQDTYEELFDFFERRVDVLNDALELLNANLENVVGSNAKNLLIDAQIGINKESASNYTDALLMYQQKALEALSKVPEDLRQITVDGSVSMTNFIGSENEEIVNAIKDYQKWSDKVSDCQQELAKLKETLRQLELDKFNNIIEDFTNQFDISTNAQSLINKQIDLFEEAGELIGKGFYEGLIKESQGQLSILEQEKQALVNELNAGLETNLIE